MRTPLLIIGIILIAAAVFSLLFFPSVVLMGVSIPKWRANTR